MAALTASQKFWGPGKLPEYAPVMQYTMILQPLELISQELFVIGTLYQFL